MHTCNFVSSVCASVLCNLLVVFSLCKMLVMEHDLFRHQNVPGPGHKGNYCFVYSCISRNTLAFSCVHARKLSCWEVLFWQGGNTKIHYPA